ncbi:MAG: iron-containing alcohol dehydrogenase [Chloroflexi bacterium]|nr:iron-containing alcohol dehydrogenase [Chloroflexota bacterium]
MAATRPATHLAEDRTLDDVRARLARSTHPERLRPIGMHAIVQGGDVLGHLPDLVRAYARPGSVVVLTDASSMERHGRDLKADIVALLAPFGARVVTLGTPGAEVHADLATVAHARRALAGAGCVVSVGSGTICDIGKAATQAVPIDGSPAEDGAADGSLPAGSMDGTSSAMDIPYLVIQTACSVNAFTDDMAVLLVRGAKRTLPSRWPDALVIDLGVVAGAPDVLNQAGVGELTSVFTGPADQLLASEVGLDPGYDEAVVGLFRDDAERLREVASGIARRDGASLAWLCDRMTRSGLALGVAGRTAPISGAEHAISHLLDMAAIRTGSPTGYHGAQVGVAAVVVAALWQDLLERFDPVRLLDQAPEERVARARIDQVFGRFDPSGETAEECWRLYGHKLRAWVAAGPARERLIDAWPAVRARIESLLAEPAWVVGTLRAAGAPTTFSDLGADPVTARWAVANAHLLRDRFGVLDLADLAGRWTDADVDRVLARAAAAGGGL